MNLMIYAYKVRKKEVASGFGGSVMGEQRRKGRENGYGWGVVKGKE